MGNSRFSTDDYKAYATSSLLNDDGTRKLRSHTFARRETASEFNPLNIKIRESRDSEANPNSRAIILGLDVTGSMGFIAEELAQDIIPKLMTTLIDGCCVPDPHIMCVAIGDHYYDRSPIQATQFEADTKIVQQLQNLYLEGGGGGNNHESYHLAWYFADKYTSIDCFEKRKVKGFLFTIGDEQPVPDSEPLRSSDFKNLFKDGDASELRPTEILKRAQEKYEVFHIIVEEGSYCRGYVNRVLAPWKEQLGKRAILLNDYTQLSPVIRAVIAVSEGADPEDVINNTEGKKAQNSVRHALYGIEGQIS